MMRVLEARFHPWRRARGPFVVVARVLCRRQRAVVQPTASVTEVQPDRDTMLQKLDYLVAHSGRNAFRGLLELRSEFWSFVEIDNATPE